MRERLLIIGAGGHGKVVADIALRLNRWERIAFLDDDESIKELMGIEVIGKWVDANIYKRDSDIFVGIGNNRVRKKIQENLESAGVSIPILIHPSAVIAEQIELGIGTAVMAGAVINCCTKIGKGCIINTGATIDHDNIIEDYVHISPGVNIAGTVKVGQCSWIGIGSKVSNNINIVSGCKVGAGTVIVKNIAEQGTYVGIPARKIR